jgi:hypothetical protein
MSAHPGVPSSRRRLRLPVDRPPRTGRVKGGRDVVATAEHRMAPLTRQSTAASYSCRWAERPGSALCSWRAPRASPRTTPARAARSKFSFGLDNLSAWIPDATPVCCLVARQFTVQPVTAIRGACRRRSKNLDKRPPHTASVLAQIKGPKPQTSPAATPTAEAGLGGQPYAAVDAIGVHLPSPLGVLDLEASLGRNPRVDQLATYGTGPNRSIGASMVEVLAAGGMKHGVNTATASVGEQGLPATASLPARSPEPGRRTSFRVPWGLRAGQCMRMLGSHRSAFATRSRARGSESPPWPKQPGL